MGYNTIADNTGLSSFF